MNLDLAEAGAGEVFACAFASPHRAETLAALGQRTVRWLLYPLANGFRARHALWLGLAGLAVLAMSLLVTYVMA